MPESLTFLCKHGQLAERQAKGFDPWGEGRATVLALLLGGGKVKVYRNSCPHLNVAMQYRKDRFMSGDGAHIVCFAHGALFRPEDGECIVGPCLGQFLTPLAHQVDSAGDIWLLGGSDPAE